jgi:uncharacterized protein YebE (UPF0316 family)
MLEYTVSNDFFAWVVLPLLIFFARICDVSLGTIRVIFISKGFKYIAPVIGFFEVIIWLLAIGQVMNNIDNVASYIAYGAGFAAGTFIGMKVEERLSLGMVILRVITPREAVDLVTALRDAGFGVTSMDAEGSSGKVKIIFMVLKRQDLTRAIGIVNEYQPKAFYSIEDVKTAAEGVFPDQGARGIFNLRDPFGFFGSRK